MYPSVPAYPPALVLNFSIHVPGVCFVTGDNALLTIPIAFKIKSEVNIVDITDKPLTEKKERDTTGLLSYMYIYQ